MKTKLLKVAFQNKIQAKIDIVKINLFENLSFLRVS